jgi:hypothetical protein
MTAMPGGIDTSETFRTFGGSAAAPSAEFALFRERSPENPVAVSGYVENMRLHSLAGSHTRKAPGVRLCLGVADSGGDSCRSPWARICWALEPSWARSPSVSAGAFC